ncbi:MAG: MlaC/ttg2D family ABC transporter substrate-binding protein [Alphaproteobacteria bacterium]|nr:MAG: hypothetical protein B6I23_02070 [Rickettsiaceae bacterium 4572_127]
MKKLLTIFAMILAISTQSFAGMNEADTKKAYDFVQKVYEKINKKVLSKNLTRDKRYTLVKDILVSQMDIEKISRFILGQHWKKAKDLQKEAFKTLFTEFQAQRFTNILNEYKGQKISILGTEKASGKKQTFVKMTVVNEKDKKAEPIELKWRARKTKSSFKITDVIIGGISMTLTLKNDYSAMIKKSENNGHNGLDALIDELDKKIELERKK